MNLRGWPYRAREAIEIATVMTIVSPFAVLIAALIVVGLGEGYELLKGVFSGETIITSGIEP